MRLSPFGLIDRALAPPPHASRLEGLLGTPYAHRGLHGTGRIENSTAAFDAAIGAGHGIELDVQASREGEPIVIHDYNLARLTGLEGKVAERSAAELGAITLSGSGQSLATLAETLRLVRSRAPLLIEVKAPDRHVGRLCAGIRRALEGYRGPAAIMSFNPEIGRWFARHAPRIVRGLVVTEQDKRGPKGRIERHLALWRAKPDFLAYDIRDLPSRFAAAQRRRGLKVLTWTVRSEAERARAAVHADQIIYETV